MGESCFVFFVPHQSHIPCIAAAPPWLVEITGRLDAMNDTVNTTKNDLRTLTDTVNTMRDELTTLTNTVNTRFDRVERQMKVFQNTLRGAGNVIQYDPILNDAGAPLPLVCL